MSVRFVVVNTSTGDVLHEADTLGEAVDAINDNRWRPVKIELASPEEVEDDLA